MTDLLGPASAPNAATTRVGDYRSFGSADTWFKDCSTPASADGTAIQAALLNGVLAQLRAAIRGNGQLASGTGPVVVETNTVDGLLLSAVQQLIARGQPNFGLDTGTADALVVAPATPWPEYLKGARLWLIKSSTAGANATTTPTVAVSGLTPVTIVRRDGSVIAVGDLPSGSDLCLQYDGTKFRLVGVTLSDIVAPGVTPGRLLRVSVFTTNGSFTPLANTGSLIVEGIGGGGAGGGVNAGASSWGVGGGGAPGAWGRVRFTTGFSGPVAVVIGSPGYGTAFAGGAATATSFGSLATWPGGAGGNTNVQNNVSGSFTADNGAPGTAITTSGIVQVQVVAGVAPSDAILVPSIPMTFGAHGAPSPLGIGGGTGGSTDPHAGQAVGFGSGGAGRGAGPNTSIAGGQGAPGILIISEYSA